MNRERFRYAMKISQKDWWNGSRMPYLWEKGALPVFEPNLKESINQSGFYEGLGTQSALLDLAVGAYSYIEKEKLPGSKLYAVDLSHNLLKRLRENDPSYKGYTMANATALPIASNTFDRVLSTYMMRYLSPEEQVQSVVESVRVTRAGGRIDILDLKTTDYYNPEISEFVPATLEEDFLSKPTQEKLASLGKTVTFTKLDIFPNFFFHLRVDVHKQ